MEQAVRVTGILAMLAALLYGIGDVFLLAGKVNLDDYPKLKPYAKLLSDTERMVAFPFWRLAWGALLGVFATPLYLAGMWQIYHGLSPLGLNAALPPVLIWVVSAVIGAFVHGTFYFFGEYVQALNKVGDDSQHVIVGMIERHKKILIISYAPVLLLAVIASIWFSALVAFGGSRFPVWMAAVNPVTLTVAWLLSKRVLPGFIRDRLEGAGFNIAYFFFFLMTTITLWNVA
jgi:hypothetical protein